MKPNLIKDMEDAMKAVAEAHGLVLMSTYSITLGPPFGGDGDEGMIHLTGADWTEEDGTHFHLQPNHHAKKAGDILSIYSVREWQ